MKNKSSVKGRVRPFFSKSERVKLILKKRKRMDSFFKLLCLSMVSMCGFLLILILFGIVLNSVNVLYNYKITLPISIDATYLVSKGPSGYDASRQIIDQAVRDFASSRCGLKPDSQTPNLLTDNANFELMNAAIKQQFGPINEVKVTLPWRLVGAISDKDYKGNLSCIINAVKKENRVSRSLNLPLFRSGDSFSPEFAGVFSALMGSIFSMLVSVFIAAPIGILSGICLFEVVKKNAFISILEAAINNLASVPSIIFGVLGFTFYVGIFGLPRGSSLVAGLTLAVMMLPHVISATKLSLQGTPQYVRDGAFALGASRMQTLVHHIFPLALPGILHGMLLSIARVIGESSPLLMLGLVAFVVDAPKTVMDKATVLPVQVYMWSNSADFNFVGLASVVLLLLLAFLFILNLMSLFVRRNSDYFSF